MRSIAHCMPIYLLGSLQYFADTRRAGESPSVKAEAPSATPVDSIASPGMETHAAGVGAGMNGEGR